MHILQPATVPSARVQALAMHKAIAVIRTEHRSLREVLKKMKSSVHDMLARQTACDCADLRLMLRYIRTFPESLHHPKEDLYLFPKLRERTGRTGNLDAIIAKLSAHHSGGEEWLDKLELGLTRFERGFPPAFAEFKAALDIYCKMQCEHMQLEESAILPAAAEHLSVEDWEEITAAFGTNGDPRFSAEQEKPCHSLYARISLLGARTAE